MTLRIRSLFGSLAAVAFSAALIGAGPSPSPAPSASPTPQPDAVTHHVAHLGGKTIPYTARAGTISLHDAKEQIAARMFYVAYTKDGADHNKRPVTFFYNGGPGSSTIWLHMSSFSPVRVVFANAAVTGGPPFTLAPNGYSLLDKSDLVFVDAPNTGYSRVLPAGDPKDFIGVDQDGRAFSQFIQNYISTFGRWNSPKFLFGESYGTTRDCVLVNMLQGAGVQMNGVVLLSSILNFGLGGGGGFGGPAAATGDWSNVFYLPTEAATAWYHKKANAHGKNLDAFLVEVETFALGRYFHALAKGSDLSRSEYDGIVRQLHDYLGLSEDYIRASNLRIPYTRFEKELMRDQATILGRYDSRFMTYDLDNAADRGAWDPSDVAISGAIVGSFNNYIHGTLHYNTDLRYRPTAYGGELGAPWDMHHAGNDPPANVAPDLAEAMAQNPHLRVFSANGRYDFATPYFATVYTLTHLGLPPALQKHVRFGFYESGHMVHLNPATIGLFRRDLGKFYDDALAGR
jgi:carboxypeptidase C (cathepsin A)